MDISWIYSQFLGLTESRVSLKVSEWAEQNRVLPNGLTPIPGPWNNDITPYLVEIMDCFSDTSSIQKVAIMKGTQLGFTTGVLENFMGYVIDYSPAPILFLTGDQEMAASSMELKIDRMLESTGLDKKIFSQSEKRHGKKTGDTKSKKEFPGGFLLAYGPRSGSKLRTFSIKYLLRDEIDAYPLTIGKEGDPLKISEKRTDAFEMVRKILDISTPIEENTSRITQRFKQGDQRYYNVKCKHCNKYQVMKWPGMNWECDKDGVLIYDSVYYECIHCGDHWKNHDKVDFLGSGKWVPTCKAKEHNMRSYHLSALYSPVGMKSWEACVSEYIEAKDDINALHTFYNTVLGIAWQDQGDAPKYELIMSNAGGYNRGEVSSKALFLTMGVDVQLDRIECELVAWGRNMISWSVDYYVLPVEDELLPKNNGSGTEDLNCSSWKELENILTSEYPIENGGGKMHIQMAFIDSGYSTNTVYEFCSKFDEGVFPVMGSKYKRGEYYKAFKVKTHDLTRFDLQADQFKSQLYSNLRKEAPTLNSSPYPSGYCHFPAGYDQKFYKMLTAEIKKKEVRKDGTTMRIFWELPKGRRNEALDTRVYAIGAVYVYAAMVSEDVYKTDSIMWREFWDYCENLIKDV